MSWGKKRIAGEDFDLAHLDSFIFPLTPSQPGAPTFRVRVSFGSHTFTKELLPEHTPDLHFNDGREKRCFCPERHKLSFALPDIVREAKRAYFSQRTNFLFVQQPEGYNAPYVVFFNVKRAKPKSDFEAAMFVESAYLKPALPTRLPAITLATLISKTVLGQPIKRP